jgi:dihydroorotase
MPDSLLIANGSILDSERGAFAAADVRIDRGIVGEIGPGLAPNGSRVLDARGAWIVPGHFDPHVHVLDGISVWGVPAESIGWRTGATTILDAGSAGSSTWPGFRRHFIEPAETRVLALLNISTIGLITGSLSGPNVGELVCAKYFDVGHATECIEANRDRIVGVKVRLSLGLADSEDLERLAFNRALELAERVRLPLMVHHALSSVSTPELVERLRPGDICTHTYHGHAQGIVDADLRVLPEVHRARERGILFDVGHGAGAFSWRVARAACTEGFWPDLMGTDLHHYNIGGPVFNVATTLSKFLHLGMAPERIFTAAAVRPYRIFCPAQPELGAIRVGRPAELGIWRLRREPVALRDVHKAVERAEAALVPTGVYYRGAYRPLDDAAAPREG